MNILKWFNHTCDPLIEEVVKIKCGACDSHISAINKEAIGQIRGMEPQQIRAHEADISRIVDIKAFNLELESMADQQVYWLAEKALNETQLAFGRGTLNGINLIKERFVELAARHEQTKQKQGSFDPYTIIPENN